MMGAEYRLPLADPQAVLAIVGGKGESLARLAVAGFPVPDGFHVTTAAYREVVAQNDLQPAILTALKQADPGDPASLEAASRRIGELFEAATIPPEVASAIAHGYASLSGTNPPVAVRSSATAEDLPEASFAGQQDSYLNVTGSEAVLEAVHKCWASLWTARAIGYRLRQGIDQNTVQLAVVVQVLVPAEAAGILFTADPITGERDHAQVSAAWGLGESIVAGLVTPDAFTVHKATGKVIQKAIADKQAMTVRSDRGTRQESVPEALRRAPALSEAQVAELVGMGVRIEELYGKPMDIEWTLCDGKLAIVQARPITTLGEKPLEWIRPDPKSTYMRGSVVDLMPDPLSPLFITLGLQTLMEQMTPMTRQMTHSDPVLPDDFYTTINSYAYVSASYPAGTMWWMLTRVIPSYPRMLRNAVGLWRDELRPAYLASAAGQPAKSIPEMTPGELWSETQTGVTAAMRYVAALLFATMGASAGSELLLTNVYNKMVKREEDPDATVLLMGWNNIPVRAEKSLYDLAMWCRERPGLSAAVLGIAARDLVGHLRRHGPPAGVEPAEWAELGRRFGQHLKEFGHIVFQLDFAAPLPLDDPAPMLETVKMYLQGKGVNPHERQQAREAARQRTAAEALSRLRGFKRWAFKTALGWGQSMAEVREDALAEIGLAYPMIREALHELGRRLADSGAIQQADDVHFLEKAELNSCVAALEAGRSLENLADRVQARRSFVRRVAQVTPPPMIPMKKRVMGIKTEVFIAASEEQQSATTLKGVAASGGTVTAPACVLRGPEDFDQMRPGAVLVAGATTPAWTPLFAMAAAVVTDIGGPHSHGSIVAREYGVPAVMGTGVATRFIRTGQIITVDGSAGTVTLSEDRS
jgi:rifampicin phosphotransferase